MPHKRSMKTTRPLLVGLLRLILTAVAIAGYASSGGGAHPLATVTLKYAQRTLSQKPPG